MSKPTPKADQLKALRIAAAEAAERMAKTATEKRERKPSKTKPK